MPRIRTALALAARTQIRRNRVRRAFCARRDTEKVWMLDHPWQWKKSGWAGAGDRTWDQDDELRAMYHMEEQKCNRMWGIRGLESRLIRGTRADEV